MEEKITPLQRKVKAKFLKHLLKKYRGNIKSYYETANFKGICAILLRRTMEGEFLENIKLGKLDIKHTDGTERYINIPTQGHYRLPYGKKDLYLYILHEDSPIPLGILDPSVSSLEMNKAIELVYQGTQEMRAKEIQAWADLAWKIGLAIVVIIVAYGVYVMLKPVAPPAVPQIIG